MQMAGNRAKDGDDKVSPYLLVEPPTLRDACRALQRDDGGRRCPSCAVRDFCRRQAERTAAAAQDAAA